jgi:hypothetical protein
MEVAAIHSGMNSAAADVRMPEGRYAAKWVPDQSEAAPVASARSAARTGADWPGGARSLS